MGEVIQFPKRRITSGSRVEQVLYRARQINMQESCDICPPVLVFWEKPRNNVKVYDFSNGGRDD